jgi:Putative amidoligase enzyme
VLKAFQGSTWREDVEAAWEFLQQHYHVLGTGYCSTHIHISTEPRYTLQDIKRIAAAAIHFEPALEALVPPVRRGNLYAKSNWLDSALLGRKGKSRSESIAAIDQVTHPDELLELMQTSATTTDRAYAWNFSSLYSQKGTIEFRKPPVSLTSQDALSWAEFVLSFVHASIRCEIAQLRKVPSNVGGLRWFLRQFEVPDLNEPHRMDRLWRGKDPSAAVQPTPRPQVSLSQDELVQERLKKKTLADKRQIQEFAKDATEPYW